MGIVYNTGHEITDRDEVVRLRRAIKRADDVIGALMITTQSQYPDFDSLNAAKHRAYDKAHAAHKILLDALGSE